MTISDSHSRGIAVICTKDRPDEIKMSCTAVYAASPSIPILVVDASMTEATRYVCDSMSTRYGRSLKLLYRRAHQSGLARQRNEAIGICRDLGVELIHFIDDDTEVLGGYFDAIEDRFRKEPAVFGVGGIVINQLPVTFLTLKRLFLLGSRRHGAVLRSGRNMMGQYPNTLATDHVDWLGGCSMSYRLSAFDGIMFDGRLTGYSLGEDYDFSFRLSRRHRLVVEPSATCIHHLTPTVRGSMRTHAQQRTQLTHRWVGEHRSFGMSRLAFWWSTLGDFLLRMGYGVLRLDRETLLEALGVLDGVRAILRERVQTVMVGANLTLPRQYDDD